MPTKAKKKHKMDPRFVSNQAWELKYIADKFEVQIHSVKLAKETVGKSRRKVYAWIRGLKSNQD